MARYPRPAVSSSPQSGPIPTSQTTEELAARYAALSARTKESAFALRCQTNKPPYIRHFASPSSPLVIAELYDRQLLNPTILRYRIDHMARFHTTTTTEHFPSSPSRPPRYSLYFRDLQSPRIASHGFCTIAAASSFLNLVIGNQKPNWSNSREFILGDSLLVQCEHLEDIVEEDSNIPLPYPYPDLANRIAGRSSQSFIPEPTSPPDTPAKQKSARTSRASTTPRQPRQSGATHITDIASTLGLQPQKARAILRKHDIAKPYEWADPKDIERITNLLKGK